MLQAHIRAPRFQLRGATSGSTVCSCRPHCALDIPKKQDAEKSSNNPKLDWNHVSQRRHEDTTTPSLPRPTAPRACFPHCSVSPSRAVMFPSCARPLRWQQTPQHWRRRWLPRLSLRRLPLGTRLPTHLQWSSPLALQFVVNRSPRVASPRLRSSIVLLYWGRTTRHPLDPTQ